jgi:formyltetrahydrofolate deformylase
MTIATALRGTLVLSCREVPGIVFAVARFLLRRDCTIVESQQFQDPDSGRFFMRVQFARADGGPLDIAGLQHEFAPDAAEFGMSWRLVDASQRQRVLIMVSKFGHCLNDLLFRISVGELRVDVVAVVSNHPDLGRLAGNSNVPFLHIPVTPETKPAAEAELTEIMKTEQVDLVVLARYMQILSPGLCAQLEGRAINIHHSMLPSFKGASPYRQAHDRGVKLIGATAHYVTSDLDEGPIIEQEMIRVDHSMNSSEFVTVGRGVECRALARAVRWHAENRVLLNGRKTVVFR